MSQKRRIDPRLFALLFAALVLTGLVAPLRARPAAAASDDSSIVFTNDSREASGSPHAYVGLSLAARVVFYDASLPPSVTRWPVRVTSTTDRAGILIWGTRELRASSGYWTSFAFSDVSSSQSQRRILVHDGDAVTVAYADVADGATATATTSWHAGSSVPDRRELRYSNADAARPVVRGGRYAVGPGATVRVYTDSPGGMLVSTAAARADGSFDLPFATNPAPDLLWVSATEPGAAESDRVFVVRAVLAGRVVLPDNGVPVYDAFGETDTGGAITNRDGRFAFEVGSTITPGPGDHPLSVRNQGNDLDRAAGVTWPRSSAYGDAPARTVHIGDPSRTTDVGDISLLAPNVFGYVHAGTFAVDEAQLDFIDPNGPGYLGGGGYTRTDGRFALHVADGDYRLRVQGPVGCGVAGDVTVALSVRGGVASPPSVDVDLSGGTVASSTSAGSVPVGAGSPTDFSLTLPTGDAVDVSIPDPSGRGSVSAGCLSTATPGATVVAPPVELVPSGISFSSATVCMTYTAAEAQATGLDESSLDLLHFLPDGTAQPITVSRDLAAHRICGVTRSFSPFGVGKARSSSSPPPPSAATAPSSPDAAPGPAPTPAEPVGGYWMVTAGGDVYSFGGAGWFGNAAPGAHIAVDLEPTPSRNGYWITDEIGRVWSFGDAPYLGGGPALAAGEVATSLSSTVSGRGYWLFTSRGRVVTYGDAAWLGDIAGTRLNGPVLDSIPTRSGRGYYMVASDGGIFTFGDAEFIGSMGATPLNAPVQSLVPDADGVGYWLVASDGGIFAFGAPFHGSMGATRLNRPITGMVGSGDGYLMVGEDGGIFTFGAARFAGSLGDHPPARPVTSVAA
ncbi:MAG TPA: hypothetical protein VM143_02360 [Acidimicrobiales bacterium]|nr:hypothetical protein [Acidimicrobiales bacterium]